MLSKAEILKDPEIFATTALALMFDEFGTEVTEWDPDVLGIEIREAFSVEPSDALLDRLLAAMAVLSSNSFFVDVKAFTTICNSLNRGVVMSDTWVPADLDDILWAVTEVRFLMGEYYSEEDYSHDVKRYVGVMLQQQGIRKIPSVLSFAEVDDTVTEVYDAYSGDAVMEQAFWDSQQEDRDNLESENIDKIDQYMAQIRTLPLDSPWIDSLKN
jgi:hypothetical protein